MAATYDITLQTDKDWVRFLCGDRTVSPASRARLTDEEIEGLLATEANVYFAAARACEIILHRSGGVMEKYVGDLKLKFAGNPEDAYLRYIKGLRAEGARRLQPRPKILKVFRVT